MSIIPLGADIKNTVVLGMCIMVKSNKPSNQRLTEEDL